MKYIQLDKQILDPSIISESSLHAIDKFSFNKSLTPDEYGVLQEGLVNYIREIPQKIENYRIQKIVSENYYNPDSGYIAMIVDVGDGRFFEYTFDKTTWINTITLHSNREVIEHRKNLINSGYVQGYDESRLRRLFRTLLRVILRLFTFAALVLMVVMIGFALVGIAFGSITLIVSSVGLGSIFAASVVGAHLYIKRDKRKAQADKTADVWHDYYGERIEG